MRSTQSRRQFLTTLSLAGVSRLVAAPAALAEERPLETTSVRLAKHPGICSAPQHIVVELLRAEGFTDIRHVPLGVIVPDAIAQGGRFGRQGIPDGRSPSPEVWTEPLGKMDNGVPPREAGEVLLTGY